MKCSNCGNNLTLEQAFCPYCGTKNIQAQKHAMEMERYSKSFEETQKDVLENSKHFKALTIKCTIIAILGLLIVLTIMALQNNYEIRRFFTEKTLKRDYEKYAGQMQKYEEERKYLEIREYMNQNDLEYSDLFREYTSVYNVSSAYYTYMMYLHLLIRDNPSDSHNDSEYIERIASAIQTIQNATVEDSYKQKYGMLEEPHLSFINDMKLEIQSVTQAFFNLSDEEAASIWEMSEAHRTVLLEEGYANE